MLFRIEELSLANCFNNRSYLDDAEKYQGSTIDNNFEQVFSDYPFLKLTDAKNALGIGDQRCVIAKIFDDLTFWDFTDPR
jgi:hypothetical protein